MCRRRLLLLQLRDDDEDDEEFVDFDDEDEHVVASVVRLFLLLLSFVFSCLRVSPFLSIFSFFCRLSFLLFLFVMISLVVLVLLPLPFNGISIAPVKHGVTKAPATSENIKSFPVLILLFALFFLLSVS